LLVLLKLRKFAENAWKPLVARLCGLFFGYSMNEGFLEDFLKAKTPQPRQGEGYAFSALYSL